MAALPEILTNGSVQLRCWSPSFAEAMLIAIEESFAELEQWMDWAQEVPTVGGLREGLRQGELDFHADRGWDYTIFDAESDDVMGGVGLHRTEDPGRFEISYWVRTSQTRRGLATLAARTVISAASTGLDSARQIMIRMDQANLTSASVAKRLGFELHAQVAQKIAAAGHTGRGYVWTIDLPE
jgi:RimJ/RimL family protein N-acetyltransferase